MPFQKHGGHVRLSIETQEGHLLVVSEQIFQPLGAVNGGWFYLSHFRPPRRWLYVQRAVCPLNSYSMSQYKTLLPWREQQLSAPTVPICCLSNHLINIWLVLNSKYKKLCLLVSSLSFALFVFSWLSTSVSTVRVCQFVCTTCSCALFPQPIICHPTFSSSPH